MKDFFNGLRYMEAKNYEEAIACFKKCKAYKHLVRAYAKAGQYETALDLADTYGFYQLGANLAKHIGDQNQVAYFNIHFNPKAAARLYRDMKCYYEAGYCYLLINDALGALDMFSRCQEIDKYQLGLELVTDYTRILYLKKDYSTAFRVFLELEDYFSALECAYKLKEKELINSCKVLIAQDAISQHNYFLAAQCYEDIDPQRASCLYAKAGSIDHQIDLLIKIKDYKQAMKVCCFHKDLNRAYEIAACYDPSLLSS